MSRRNFLLGAGISAGSAILAACGGSSGATYVPAATPAPQATAQTAASSLAAGILPFVGKPERTKVTIAVGETEQPMYGPVSLANHLNYFKDYGIDVEVASFPDGAKAAEALIGGSVDMVVGFYDHMIQTQPKGDNLQMICLYDNFPSAVLMVSSKNADKIRAAADLKGQNVGITSAGSSTHFLLNYYLAKNGIQPDQVNVVAIGTGSTAITAIQQGNVAVAMMVDPAATKVEMTGDAKPLWDTRTVRDTTTLLGGAYPAGGIYTTTDFIAKYPYTTQWIVTASVKALKFIQLHTPDVVVSHISQDIVGDDKASYLNALKRNQPLFSTTGYMPPDGPINVLNVLNLTAQAAKGTANIDLKATYTNQFIDIAGDYLR